MTRWIVACAVVATMAFGAGCGKKSCGEAAANIAKIKWPDKTAEERKERADKMTAECKEEKISQEAIDCAAKAGSKDDLEKCPRK